MSATGKVIFLVGFMGSGKSHYGKGLSALLHVPYVDLDSRIEKQEGMSIPEIFSQKGEAYFRQIETQLLHQVTQEMIDLKDANQGNLSIFGIVACGGGAPCFNGNMNWMNEMGLTVWLAPPLEVLLGRLGRENQSRPLVAGLQGEELERQVRERLAARQRFYAMASIQVTEPDPSHIELLKIIGYAQENV